MEDSIFTRIIKGGIPCHKVYEDDKTLAFLDIHPAQPGHTLVVPKAQVDHVWDLDDDGYTALWLSAKKVARRLQEVLGTARVGVRVEGFDVPHAHIHLIPINSGADFKAQGDKDVPPDHDALAAMAGKLSF
jgi:histidine triad (HIT) family protein